MPFYGLFLLFIFLYFYDLSLGRNHFNCQKSHKIHQKCMVMRKLFIFTSSFKTQLELIVTVNKTTLVGERLQYHRKCECCLIFAFTKMKLFRRAVDLIKLRVTEKPKVCCSNTRENARAQCTHITQNDGLVQ